MKYYQSYIINTKQISIEQFTKKYSYIDHLEEYMAEDGLSRQILTKEVWPNRYWKLVSIHIPTMLKNKDIIKEI
jgi:hypothetical protein